MINTDRELEATSISIWNDVLSNLRYANIHVWTDGAKETKDIVTTIDWDKRFAVSGRGDIIHRAISGLTASISEKIINFAQQKKTMELMIAEPLTLALSYNENEHRDILTAKLTVGVE